MCETLYVWYIYISIDVVILYYTIYLIEGQRDAVVREFEGVVGGHELLPHVCLLSWSWDLETVTLTENCHQHYQSRHKLVYLFTSIIICIINYLLLLSFKSIYGVCLGHPSVCLVINNWTILLLSLIKFEKYINVAIVAFLPKPSATLADPW